MPTEAVEYWVVIALDKQTGDTYISNEMLVEKCDKVAAEEVKKGLESTMGEVRTFHLVTYLQAIQLLETNRQQHESPKKNRRIIN